MRWVGRIEYVTFMQIPGRTCFCSYSVCTEEILFNCANVARICPTKEAQSYAGAIPSNGNAICMESRYPHAFKTRRIAWHINLEKWKPILTIMGNNNNKNNWNSPTCLLFTFVRKISLRFTRNSCDSHIHMYMNHPIITSAYLVVGKIRARFSWRAAMN